MRKAIRVSLLVFYETPVGYSIGVFLCPGKVKGMLDRNFMNDAEAREIIDYLGHEPELPAWKMHTLLFSIFLGYSETGFQRKGGDRMSSECIKVFTTIFDLAAIMEISSFS